MITIELYKSIERLNDMIVGWQDEWILGWMTEWLAGRMVGWLVNVDW